MGRSASDSKRDEIKSLLGDLEDLCTLPEPARDSRMNGGWIVLYTDCPPPSNGQVVAARLCSIFLSLH